MSRACLLRIIDNCAIREIQVKFLKFKVRVGTLLSPMEFD